METLVDKRQHTLQHITKVISDEGGFWLNTVHINAKDIKEFMKHDADIDMRSRVNKLFSLGVSLSKLLDVVNVSNIVSTLGLISVDIRVAVDIFRI